MDTAVLTINQSPTGYKQVIVYPPMQDTVYTLTEEYDKVDNSMVSAIDGVWKLNKSSTISAGGVAAVNDVTQYKIYQGGHFIWCAGNLDLSTAKNHGVFGFGTFTLNGPKLTEINTSSTYTSQLVGVPVLLNIKFSGKKLIPKLFCGQTGQNLQRPTAGLNNKFLTMQISLFKLNGLSTGSRQAV